jgi:hypothetical protein
VADVFAAVVGSCAKVAQQKSMETTISRMIENSFSVFAGFVIFIVILEKKMQMPRWDLRALCTELEACFFIVIRAGANVDCTSDAAKEIEQGKYDAIELIRSGHAAP